jgi:type II secretory pathway pseudopilin PulG
MARHSHRGDAMRAGRRDSGFTYLGLMAAIVILGILLTTAGRVWSFSEQRDKEAQLLWVGHAYRDAIASYYVHGGQFPQSLEQLLQDDRSPVPLRHLRQLYPDPMTGAADWTLISDPMSQRIMGVASSSKATPIKRKGFELVDGVFTDTDCYCLWQFVYWPRRFGAPLPSGVNVPPPGTSPAPTNPGACNPGSNASPSGGCLLTPGTTMPLPAPTRPH